LRAYLEFAGHGADLDEPQFRPLRHNGKRQEERRAMDPDAIDRVVRKYAGELGLDRGYSAHSMRATSSRRRSRMAPSSRTCRKPPGTGTPAPLSSTTVEAIIRRRPRAFLRRTDAGRESRNRNDRRCGEI
jgi:hypothetical protein